MTATFRGAKNGASELELAVSRRCVIGRSREDTRYRQTSTGIVLCVRTLVVSLPSTRAETPLRPCDAMQIRSHCLSRAVAMIAR